MCFPLRVPVFGRLFFNFDVLELHPFAQDVFAVQSFRFGRKIHRRNQHFLRGNPIALAWRFGRIERPVIGNDSLFFGVFAQKSSFVNA